MMEPERGAAVWELPTVCFGDEVHWLGSKCFQRRLDSVQVQVGRKVLGASWSVAFCAVRGERVWRSMAEERVMSFLVDYRGWKIQGW